MISMPQKSILTSCICALFCCASSSADEEVRLVYQYGKLLGLQTVAAMSPDGKFAVTSSSGPAKFATTVLWHLETGRVIRHLVLPKHNNASPNVFSLCYSPDGRFLSVGRLADILLVELKTGKVKSFDIGLPASAFSPDGKYFVLHTKDKSKSYSLGFWDLEAGKFAKKLPTTMGPHPCLAFSSDGKWLLRHSEFRPPGFVIDASTGDTKSTVECLDPVFVDKGTELVIAGRDEDKLVFFDPTTGKLIQTVQSDGGRIFYLVLAPAGKCLLALTERGTRRYDLEKETWSKSPASFKKFSRNKKPVVSPDGRAILFLRESMAEYRNLLTGGLIQELKAHDETWIPTFSKTTSAAVLQRASSLVIWDWDRGQIRPIQSSRTFDANPYALDPEKKVILGLNEKGCIAQDLVDPDKAKLLFECDPQKPLFCGFSPDGKHVLMIPRDKKAFLWNVASEKKLFLQPPIEHEIRKVEFSPDSKWISIAEGDWWRKGSPKPPPAKTKIWSVSTARLEKVFESSVSLFLPDGRLIVPKATSKVPRKELQFFNFETGLLTTEKHRWLENHLGESVAFSSDMSTAVVVPREFWDAGFVYDVSTAKSKGSLRGHVADVRSATFLNKNKIIATAAEDGAIRLYDDTGKALCVVYTLSRGEWAVVDAQGRFDASNGGDVPGLHWVIGDEPIELGQLKERYYDPGLLGKYLGHNKEPLREVQAFSAPKLYPEIKIAAPSRTNPRLGITLVDQGGGIGRVVVKVNGRELIADARGPKDDASGGVLNLETNLPTTHPFLVPGKKNVVEVHAFNAENYLRSRGLTVLYDVPPRPQSPVQLWAVIAGSSDYVGEKIDLRYAAKDAADFASAVKTAGTRLFGAGKVKSTLLMTLSDKSSWPTRLNLVNALQEAQKSKSTDVFVLYLAGHGVTHGGQDGDYYFLCCDAQSTDLTDPAVRAQVAMSSKELTEYLKKIPALKQVLILDTCSAGKAVEKLIDQRQVPGSQVRALDRLMDRTGIHVLAGCASDAASYEATRYAQGVLTHSLLLGMRGAALREEQFVDVSTLFSFAADKVPELARDVGGIQRPVIASPKGSSFDIGQVLAADRGAIPLQASRPLVLRTNFQDYDLIDDVLGLSPKVDEHLRNVSSRGPTVPLVFLDAREFPDAFRVAGRYRIKAGQVIVDLNLLRSGTRVDTFSVNGQTSQVDNLAMRIAQEVEKRLAKMNP